MQLQFIIRMTRSKFLSYESQCICVESKIPEKQTQTTIKQFEKNGMFTKYVLHMCEFVCIFALHKVCMCVMFSFQQKTSKWNQIAHGSCGSNRLRLRLIFIMNRSDEGKSFTNVRTKWNLIKCGLDFLFINFLFCIEPIKKQFQGKTRRDSHTFQINFNQLKMRKIIVNDKILYRRLVVSNDERSV